MKSFDLDGVVGWFGVGYLELWGVLRKIVGYNVLGYKGFGEGLLCLVELRIWEFCLHMDSWVGVRSVGFRVQVFEIWLWKFVTLSDFRLRGFMCAGRDFQILVAWRAYSGC